MTLEQARALNVQAQEYDGIAEIKSNGDIIITRESHTTFRDMLGYELKTISIETAYEQAMELRAKFHEFARTHGVKI
jgi:hypothetical protein